MPRSTGPPRPPPDADRRQTLEDSRYKLGEAEYFLSKMRALDRSPKLETNAEFQYLLSAFLTAARSALQQLCRGSGRWGWIEAETHERGERTRELYGFFRHMRNASVHEERTGANFKVELVPEREIPPSRRVALPRSPFLYTQLPGEHAPSPAPMVGVTRYTFQFRDEEVVAVNLCAEYLDLVGSLIDHRERMTTW